MKRLLLLVLLLVPSMAFAGESIGDIATWTPPMYANSVSPTGWKELTNTAQYRIWSTFVKVKKPALGIVVSLKTAEKGVDGSITGISIVSVDAVCGANGSAPNYVQMGPSESFDEHGPIDGDSGGPTVRLVPDTNLAVAVQRACKEIHAPLAEAAHIPSSGKCSTPNASYPMQAIRTGKQGVVEVGFYVDANGHAGPVSVISSSGTPSLDQAAVVAASQSVCNLPKGEHVSFPITFRTNGAN